nr:hypothetical protein [Microbacterium bovistercoris]
MKIELHAVAKGPQRARALDPVSVSFATGQAVLIEAETEQRPTVLGLVASGRMRPDAGQVLLDGADAGREIRRRVALVDAPEVCDPAPNVTVLGLVEEELMFAGRASNVISARRWLDENGFAGLVRMPISAVAARDRVALLLELTALRRDVEGMVLVSPDRHGGSPLDWWEVVDGFAARGYAMLAITGRAAAMVLRAVSPEAEEEAGPEAEPLDEPTGEEDSAEGRTFEDSGILLSPESPAVADETSDEPLADEASEPEASEPETSEPEASEPEASDDAPEPEEDR